MSSKSAAAAAEHPNDATSTSSESSRKSSSNNNNNANPKRLFTKDISAMMYGFGDDVNPNLASVEAIEDLVVRYIADSTEKAMRVSNSSRISVDDILYLLRNDRRKYSRVRDLLFMSEELKRARQAFDEDKLC